MAYMKRLGAAVWLTVLCGTIATGCGSEDPPTNTHPYPDVGTFCTGVAKAICSDVAVEACYQSSDATLDDDADTCVETYIQPARCNPKSLDYSNGASIQCVDAYSRAYKDGKLNVKELNDIAATCHAVLHGNGELGGSCAQNSDCDGSEGLSCVIKPGQAGSCQDPVSVTAGNDCTDSSAVCVAGFYCGSDNACIVRPSIGEACNAGKPCLEDALCVNDSCIEKSANGQTCIADEQCSGGICILVKGTSGGTCGAQVIMSPTAGESCTPLLP